MKVLFVDDKQENLYLAEFLLKGSGYEVVMARNGQEALKLVQSEHFDIIISDILMPVMDGFQLCKRIKADESLRHVPFVFYTSTYVDEEDEELAMSLGAERFIRKPVEPHVFVSGIKEVLSNSLEGKLIHRQPSWETEEEILKLYSQRLVHKLEQKLLDLEAEVSRRKQVEAELLVSEERFRLLYEQAPMGYQALDADGNFLEANAAWLNMLGYPREEVIGRWFGDFLVPEFRNKFKKTFPSFKKAGEIHGVEFEMLRKDGSTLTARFDGKIGRDELGNFKQTHCVLQDITEKRRAEEALRQSEERYRAIFENAAIGLQLGDTQASFVAANPALANMLGFSQEELGGVSPIDITHPDDREISLEHLSALREGKLENYRLEKRYIRKDGQTLWADLWVSALRNAFGELEGTIGIIADITGRKKAEGVQRRLAAAVEQSADGIAIIDSQGTIEYVNPSFERITGHRRDVIVGKEATFFKDIYDAPDFNERFQEAAATAQGWTLRVEKKQRDGSTAHWDLALSPVLDSSGTVSDLVLIQRDVTREVVLHDQLVQAQKMEAIGTLSGGIAHDFNNLLTVVLGYSDMLLSERKPEDRDYKDLQKIVIAGKNGAELVQRLLMFSRKGEIKPRPLNLNQQIRQAERLLFRTIPKMVSIEMILDEELKTVLADPVQIEQVLLNLSVNASDAMPDGGKLTFETRNVTLDETYSRTHLGARSGEYVLLTVSDTGVGMGKETAGHIFEPFFTTKGAGRGTGLGLAMVFGIVQQHGGYIRCYSEPNVGTSFHIYLPSAEGLTQDLTPDSQEMPAGGTETLLLVDDEEFIRDFATKVLTRAGYTVRAAANGREAIDIFKQNWRDFSLVILDLVMPEMGGKQCLQGLLEINPKAKVLIASGFAPNGPKKDAIIAGAKGFVGKPFALRELLKAVRETLDKD